MLVKDLIKKLQEFPEDTPIYIEKGLGEVDTQIDKVFLGNARISEEKISDFESEATYVRAIIVK